MRALICGLAIVLAGCGTLNEKYVKQDRMNYETLAPRIRKMLTSTTEYDGDQKKDIEDRLQAWDTWSAEGVASLEEKENE